MSEAARAKRPNNRGMVVILALATMMMVVTAVLELHISERANMMSSAVMRDRATLEQMCASGVHLAMAILIKDRLESESDSIQEDWADNETIATLLAEIPFDEGTLELEITDELSKIQINALLDFPEGRNLNNSQQELWSRFAGGLLAFMESPEGQKEKPKGDKEEEVDPVTIISCLKDWMDSGDDDAITGLNGAESDYYESLDPPYACKNGPFDHLSELRLVKGITPELFAGVGDAAGLGQYVTVYGAEKADDEKFSFPGKININTADLAVLSALLPMESAEFAPLLIEYREATSGTLYKNDITKLGWHTNVPGLAEAQIDSNLISVASQIFRITASANLNNVRVTTTAIIERIKPEESEPWQCKVLNWKTE
jgi:general secretion pathway protein K